MKVKVTQEDINKGTSRSPSYCPVARAISRQTTDYVRVGSTIIYLNLGTENVRSVLVPGHVTIFIDKFDRDRPVEPFEFELEFPA